MLKDLYESFSKVDDLKKIYLSLNFFLGANYQLLQAKEDYSLNFIPANYLENMQLYLNYLANYEEDSLNLASFDCVTFVETILAILLSAKAKNFSDFMLDFKINLYKLRYYAGKNTYLNRKQYFFDYDWLKDNAWLVSNWKFNESIRASAKINKRAHLNKSTQLQTLAKAAVVNPDNHAKILKHILTELKFLELYPTELDLNIDYISLDYLSQNLNLLEKLPDFSLINIVRSPWDLREELGTELNISHVGLALRIDKQLNFYHASSIEPKKVVALNLETYLMRYLDHPLVKGFNVYQINNIF